MVYQRSWDVIVPGWNLDRYLRLTGLIAEDWEGAEQKALARINSLVGFKLHTRLPDGTLYLPDPHEWAEGDDATS